MATTTTRLALIKPGTGDDQDVADLNLNADRLDLEAGYRICTSGTRPSSPFQGQSIYETDTQQTRVWNGTFWLWVGGSHLNIYSKSSAFTAVVGTTNVPSFARDNTNSRGPDFAPDGSGLFTLPNGIWSIEAIANVASITSQTLEIFNNNGSRVLAYTGFYAAATLTGVSAMWFSDGNSGIAIRARNASGGSVTWNAAHVYFAKVGDFQ